MSGFIGRIFDNAQEENEKQKQEIKSMTNLISHRGPDEEGYYFDSYVQFGVRSLHTITTKRKSEPLSYENDRYTIIFNGALYNYVELRDELEMAGFSFETDLDGEVVLALYSKIKEQTAEKIRGTFAFVVWDKEERNIYGARDPFGIKPLFYKEEEKQTFFASEKKSILGMIESERINTDALQHYLTYQYVPEPFTMTEGICKLEPGCYFTKEPGEKLVVQQYWKMAFHPVVKSEDAFIKEVRDVMIDSVQAHMRSDVAVGSFLSGGIDSSLVVAIAKQFDPSIKTFSVGFEREGFSEVDVAKETAEKLQVENISRIITPKEYMEELPKIIWHMDDPLADPACVPLYFVAREAKKHVTIAMSGEGADELFGGYNIYREPQSLAVFDKMPTVFKNVLHQVSTIMPEGMRGKSFLERGTTLLENRYIGNAKMFTEDEKRELLFTYKENHPFTEVTKEFYKESATYGPVEKMQYIDIHTWMRGDILLKADKMTMAHSLEVRVPFLDKKVLEVAKQIPTELKTSHETTKYILRKAAEGIVPAHVLHRKKLGFPVPIRHWLKEEMNEWAKKIITESETDHLINKKYVLTLLDNHCLGKGDYSRKIWTVLIFMIWHNVYVEGKYSFPEIE